MVADFTFSPSTGRYRDTASGKLVSARSVRDAVDLTVDEASDRLARLAERLRDGGITLSAWQTQSMQIIKDVNLATTIAAQGGKAAMDAAAWGFAGYRIRQEYAYLRGMANAIASGEQPLDGRLTARARLYGQAGRLTFEALTARHARSRGATLERNILSPGESCEACRAESDKGWAPIGTLSPPGTRSCKSNCRCRVSYSFKDEVAA